MKKIANYFFALAALLITSAAFISCVDNIIEEPTPADGTFTMIVTATKDAPTKALAPGAESTLTASWTAGDVVKVYRGENEIGTLLAQGSGASTTLAGELTEAPSVNNVLTLKYLSPNYATQDGTLAYIAANCDYATATVTVKSISGNTVTVNESSTSFTNQQAIVKFTLTAPDGTTPLNTTQLTVNDGTNTYTVTPTSATNVLYVALPGVSNKTVTLTAIVGDDHFVYEKSSVTFTKGNYYEVTVKMSALPGAGSESDPYLISSAADWNYFANTVNSGTNYAGKFFLQKADISVTTMVGVSESISFCGTYDGGGHTLTVTLNTAERYVAPFHYVKNATIKNLAVTGTVNVSGSGDNTTRRHAGGLVGLAHESCVIRNCRVSVSISGTDFMGGIVGDCGYTTITLSGCVFNGDLTVSGTAKAGGLIGWGGGKDGVTVTIENCLFAGTYTAPNQFHPIGCYNNPNLSTRVVSNTYYTKSGKNMTDDDNSCIVKGLSSKGKLARSIIGGSDVTVAHAGTESVYNVSGITSYGTGILYGGVLYAGDGEEVSLSLSHANAPAGFSFSQYTVTGGGSLNDPTSNSPTLTMSDADQTINAQWSSQTFNYTGAVQTFTVPTTGYYILECYGAQGGSFTITRGGYGGTAQLTYRLTKGDVLYLYVGGQGGSIADSRGHTEGGGGGWNGGGKGGTGVSWQNGTDTPWSGGGGGGGATHIATSAIGAISSSTSFTDNHANLLLIAGGGGGGGGGSAKGAGGNAGGATGEVGSHNNTLWNIAWNNDSHSCGEDAMLSSWGDSSCEGCGGGGGGYVGGNTWDVQYNLNDQCYSGAGGSSWGETTNGKGYSTTTGGATAGGNGKAVITWYGTTYPTE